MRKNFHIIEALPDTITNQFDFSATYIDSEGETNTYTIFETAFFIKELYQHFESRLIRLDADTPSADLISLFTSWKTSRADAYARRAYALATKYEPLNNYDRTETREGSSETTHGESITRTHNNSDTRTHLNTDTLTYAGTETETADLYGVNSVAGVPSDVNTKTFTQRTDTDAHTGTITDAHSGTITDAHSGKDSVEDGYELRAYGNIGVTTSASMLNEDFDLLKRDLALTAICDFVERYTWYMEGLDL